ncbi:hypothetical protein VE25_09810 [Devosia geojensis]|uniref:Outer membrane protein beta-barrel domain-containing protein n=1 Tax=Devosia geojensis TaxID=443610 RepID=A0A0F5FUR3_9HYPH|nr:outer membrane beta-barrel protein [Devosia geojensis]KKB11937.1 hypothetical protein VE25_09810 [Devosia geojensis]
MRKLIAAIGVAGAASIAAQALAADIPVYPPVVPELPPVDYGLGGNFYLRGSGAWNVLWAKDVDSWACPPGCGTDFVPVTFDTDDVGYGYSVGAGFGYETGTGLRFDATVDYLSNEGASIVRSGESAAVDGEYSLKLRSTVLLANVYYDFSFSDAYGYGPSGYSAAGGPFAYVGAGAGVAFNEVHVDSPATNPVNSGDNTSFAAAGMVGVGYDFGAFTADLGYRALYIAEVANEQPVPHDFSVSDAWIHEVRGTLRYRF